MRKPPMKKKEGQSLVPSEQGRTRLMRLDAERYRAALEEMGVDAVLEYLRVIRAEEREGEKEFAKWKAEVSAEWEDWHTKDYQRGMERGRALLWLRKGAKHGDWDNTLTKLVDQDIVSSPEVARRDMALWKKKDDPDVRKRIKRAIDEGFRVSKDYALGYKPAPTAKAKDKGGQGKPKNLKVAGNGLNVEALSETGAFQTINGIVQADKLGPTQLKAARQLMDAKLRKMGEEEPADEETKQPAQQPEETNGIITVETQPVEGQQPAANNKTKKPPTIKQAKEVAKALAVKDKVELMRTLWDEEGVQDGVREIVQQIEYHRQCVEVEQQPPAERVLESYQALEDEEERRQVLADLLDDEGAAEHVRHLLLADTLTAEVTRLAEQPAESPGKLFRLELQIREDQWPEAPIAPKDVSLLIGDEIMNVVNVAGPLRV
jgi:hypothetical protein